MGWRFPMIDPLLVYLIEMKRPLTLKNYLALAYWGDAESLSDLGPEDLAEIEELLIENQIVRTESEELN